MDLLTGKLVSIDQNIREVTLTLTNEVEKRQSWLLSLLLEAMASIKLYFL